VQFSLHYTVAEHCRFQLSFSLLFSFSFTVVFYLSVW